MQTRHEASRPDPTEPERPGKPHAAAPPPIAQPGENRPHPAHSVEPGQLLGTLPCCVCSYDLKGLSITANCPECNTAVRATILYRVDPEAEAFRPLNTPKLTALACRAWVAPVLITALAIWTMRALELARPTGSPAIAWSPLAYTAVAGLALSAIASIALVRPIKGGSAARSVLALLGTAVAYPALIAALALTINADAASLPAYAADRPPDPNRIVPRLLFLAAAVAAILLHRPNARELVARCKVLRTKRVDRQTLALIAATLAMAAAGDILRLASNAATGPAADTINIVGTATIALASLLTTIGLIGATIDSWRIAAALKTPPPTHAALLGEHQPTAPNTPTHTPPNPPPNPPPNTDPSTTAQP